MSATVCLCRSRVTLATSQLPGASLNLRATLQRLASVLR